MVDSGLQAVLQLRNTMVILNLIVQRKENIGDINFKSTYKIFWV